MFYFSIFGQEFYKKNYYHFWNQLSQICVFAKFHEKTKTPKFLTKNAWHRYFWAGICKKILSYVKSVPSNLSNDKIFWKRKMPKLGTKNAVFGFFGGRILKNNCHVCYQHLQIFLIAKFFQKRPKFVSKNALFGNILAGILKHYCRIWNQHPQICLFAKFHEKTKMPKLETKNA